MLQAFTIPLREGVEASMIVGIIFALPLQDRPVRAQANRILGHRRRPRRPPQSQLRRHGRLVHARRRRFRRLYDLVTATSA